MIRITPETPTHIISNVRCCVSCRHARRVDNPYKLEVVCTRFKTINLVTGVPTYYDAEGIRRDEQACGVAGKLFEPIVVDAPETSAQTEEKEDGSYTVETDGGQAAAEETRSAGATQTEHKHSIDSIYSGTTPSSTFDDKSNIEGEQRLSSSACSSDEGCSI